MVIDTGESVAVRQDRSKRRELAAGPRRGYDLDFKLKVLDETFALGASVAAVARHHGMNTNVIFRWRKLFREGRLTGESGTKTKKLPAPAFAPVRVVPDVPALPAPQPSPRAGTKESKSSPRKAGVMAITLPGGFSLRVDADIDEAALRRALAAVRDLA